MILLQKMKAALMKITLISILLIFLANISLDAQEINIKNDKAFSETDDPENKIINDPFAAVGGTVTKPRILEYSVSKSADNKANLLAIFEMVVKIEIAKLTKQSTFKILQRLDSKNYLVTTRDAPSETYLLKFDEEISAADGELIEDISFVTTDEIFEYDSVGGSKRSVRVIKFAKNNVKEMTREEFVEKLKAGHTWRFNLDIGKCDNCMGAGKFGALRNNETCGVCSGTGERALDCVVKW